MASEKEINFDYDVLVIGGGLAGLRCATLLRESGLHVAILEARNRVGGRSYSVHLEKICAPHERLDKGGAWIGPTQFRLHKLARELNCDIYKQRDSGFNVLRLGSSTYKYSGAVPWNLPIATLASCQFAAWRLDSMSLQVPLDRPWIAPRALEWDRMSVFEWIHSHVLVQEAVELFRVVVQSVFLTDIDKMSLLWFLFYIRSAGGLQKLVDVVGGAQEARFVSGTQSVSLKLEERFVATEANGHRGSVICGDAVHTIVHPAEETSENQFVTVKTAAGRTYSARLCVVALSPQLMKDDRINFTPSVVRQRLGRCMLSGSALKFMFLYETAFWRKAGYSGMLSGNHGIPWIFDNSPQSGTGGALVGALVLSSPIAKLEKQERIAKLAEIIESFLGKQALQFCGYEEQRWNEEQFTDGCVNGTLVGALTVGLGESLRSPDSRIIYAGTETAYRWNGYLEGAVESGETAACAVASLLEADGMMLNRPNPLDSLREERMEWKSQFQISEARRLYGHVQKVLEMLHTARIPVLIYLVMTFFVSDKYHFFSYILPYFVVIWLVFEVVRLILLMA